MNYRQIYSFVVVTMLMAIVLGRSLGDSVGLAQAAPAAVVDPAGLTLPPAVPPTHPQFADLVADLSITKTNGVDTIIPGQATTYTITVTNNDADDTVNASVTDTFPAELIGVTWACSGTAGATCTASGSGNISDGVNLPAGSSVTYLVTGTVSSDASGLLTNTASVSVLDGVDDPNPDNDTATDTDTLTPQADLSITKTNGQSTTIPGNSTTYTIVVSNNGPSSANDTTIQDTFPAALTSVTWSSTGSGGTCPASGSNNINCTIDLSPGSFVTFTVTGTVNPDATGTLANTASLTPPGGVTDTSSGNDTATDTDTLDPQANLSITKTNGQSTAIPGNSTTYTIVVSNSGPSSANGTTIQDTFPTTLTGVTWSRTGSGGTCPASGSSNINCTINLSPGGSVTFTASGTVNSDATGTLANTASVTPPGGVTDTSSGNDTATDTDTLTPQADLSITKTNTQASPVPGTSTTYILTISHNSGPSDIGGAAVTDAFPGSLSGITWTCGGTGGGGCQGPASGSGNLSSKLVNLPIGSSVIFTATGTIDANTSGVLTNTATVSMPANGIDPTPGNNSATDSRPLNPQANLSITKTNGQSTTIPGNGTVYTIVVSNSGPSSANGTTIQDTFPAALTGVIWSRTGSGGTCPTTTTSGNINCTINLSPGGSITFTVSGTVNPGARGTLANTASLTPPAGVTDTSSGNNSATDTDTLTPQADLRVTQSDSPDPVRAGDILTYNISVINNGPSDATGVTLFDTLPSGVTFQSATPGSPTCNAVGNSVTCNLGTVASGGSTPVTIQVRVDSSTIGALTNLASVEGVEDDPNGGNNIATANTSVQVRPDLAITKLVSANPSPLGMPLTYTLRITNNGPSDAPQVTVSDDMPSGVTLGPVTPSQGSCSGTDPITCDLGSMTSGAVAIVTIVINPTSTGPLNNTASVSVTGVGVSDPTSGNNSSSTSSTINRVTDLAITQSSTPNPVTAGNNITYNLTVINNGPSGATNVTVTDTLPTEVTFQSVTPSSCSHAGSTVTCNLGSIANGNTVPIAIVAKVDSSSSGNIVNMAGVTVSGSSDPVPENNSTSAPAFVGELFKVFLPLVTKPTPTDLFIENDTGGAVTFSVVGTGVSCNVPAGDPNYFCGSFPPGTYTVQVSSICGNLTTSKTYSSGPQSTRVFCN